jgi:hypothetical protein
MGGSDKPRILHNIEVLVDGFRWVLKRRAVLGGCFDHPGWVLIEKKLDKRVWINSCDREGVETIDWKVVKVKGDNRLSPYMDRSRQNVAIVWIWESECLNRIRVPFDGSIGERLIHQSSRPFQLIASDVVSVVEKISCPFVLDVFRPVRANEIVHGDSHQQIAELSRIEDVCVIDNNRALRSHIDKAGRQ